MKLQRHDKSGNPRNEFKEMPDSEYKAYVKRTGDRTWLPLKKLKLPDIKQIPVVPIKETPTQHKK